jgi:hypothetical protein
MRRASLAVILLLASDVPPALAQNTVSGAAFDATGAPMQGSVRLIVSRRSTAVPLKSPSTTVTSDGILTLMNVPPRSPTVTLAR